MDVRFFCHGDSLQKGSEKAWKFVNVKKELNDVGFVCHALNNKKIPCDI